MTNYQYLKEQFEAHKDAESAKKMSAYMRDQFPFYGIPTPKRKAIYKDILKKAKQQKSVDWDLLDICFMEEFREFHYFVVDYLIHMQKFLTIHDIPRIQNYIKKHPWWDTIDGLDGVIGSISLTNKEVDKIMLAWSTDTDFWLRRIAIDYQLGKKEKTNIEIFEKILINNLNSAEFFINKAIGWSLREYSKVNPDWVRNFLN